MADEPVSIVDLYGEVMARLRPDGPELYAAERKMVRDLLVRMMAERNLLRIDNENLRQLVAKLSRG